jgi:very-short-patch-repair endonuclease
LGNVPPPVYTAWMKDIDIDGKIASLAEYQHALVTGSQAIELGLTKEQRKLRVARGRLIPCDHDVFRIGGAPVTWYQRVLASCLAADGVASHRTAAMLLGLGLWPADVVELTIAPNRRYRSDVAKVHRSIDDPHLDAHTVEGIPVTSVRRTLLDLGAVVPQDRLEKCVERALFRGMTSAGALWAYIDEVGRQGRRGVQPLRAVLELRGRVPAAESDLETEMLQLLRRAGLPEPVRQHEVVVASRRFRIDLAYPDLKIAIEIDGDEPHFGASKTDADTTRDGLLQLDHWLTQHFTRRHIRHDEHASAQRVRLAIKARSLGAAGSHTPLRAKKTS